jgi:hypothetical protein
VDLILYPQHPTLFPPQSDPFDMQRFDEIISKHKIYEVGFDALSLSSLIWEKDML